MLLQIVFFVPLLQNPFPERDSAAVHEYVRLGGTFGYWVPQSEGLFGGGHKWKATHHPLARYVKGAIPGFGFTRLPEAKLTNLSIPFALSFGQFEDSDLQHLSDLNNLNLLDLTTTSISRKGILQLSLFKNLNNLIIAPIAYRHRDFSLHVNDDLLDALVRADKLHALYVCTDKDGNRPDSIDEIDKITLILTPITQKSFNSLKAARNLRCLYVQSTILDDQAIPIIREAFPKLEILRLDGTGVTDKSASMLAQMNLKEIGLGGTEITDDGIKELCKCKSLTCLSLSSMSLTDTTCDYLKSLPRLRYLSLNGCKGISLTAREELFKSRNLSEDCPFGDPTNPPQ